jgi:ketosteroid isomerase-like protein
MSQENVAVVLRTVDEFNRRDLDALADSLADDFEFVPYLTKIESTTYRGKDAFRQYFDDAGLAWETIQLRVGDIRDLGERILFFGDIRGRGKASSVEVRQPLAWIAEFKDGRIAHLHTYTDTAEALEAAGLREEDLKPAE